MFKTEFTNVSNIRLGFFNANCEIGSGAIQNQGSAARELLERLNRDDYLINVAFFVQVMLRMRAL